MSVKALTRVVALCLVALGATVASAARIEPAAPAASFSATVRYPGGSEHVSWGSPERFSVHALTGRPLLGGTWQRGGTVVYRSTPAAPASVLTGTFAAEPDGSSSLEQLHWPLDFALAQARKGTLALRPDGPGAWRLRLFAPANKCAGFGPGALELRLRRADFLPLRLVERHGSVVAHDLTFTYRSVNRPLPPETFTPPRLSGSVYREDKGFVRASPAAAARHLSYIPRLPSALPAGFKLAVSGWAPRSGTTGAEGSIPPARELFAAVYRRGLEHIDITQRLASGRDWAGDPFGAECVRPYTERARIGVATAVYGASTYSTPHLYWRSGRLLYTVSGPFPKAQLVAIARSLAPVR